MNWVQKLIEKPAEKACSDDYDGQSVFEAGGGFSDWSPAANISDHQEGNGYRYDGCSCDLGNQARFQEGNKKEYWAKAKKLFHGLFSVLMLLYGVRHPIYFLILFAARMCLLESFAMDSSTPAVRLTFLYIGVADCVLWLVLYVYLGVFRNGERYFPEWAEWL